MRGGRLVALSCALAGSASAGAEPRSSLDTPTFGAREPHAFAAFAGAGASVRVAWSQVVGAVRYHATWTDPRGRVTDVETTTGAFERNGVAPGHYTLAVGAVDVGGNRGAPTAPYAIDVVEVRAVPPGGDSATGPTRGAYAIGTTFFAPGLHCDLASTASGPMPNGLPSNELRAASAGAFHLRCANGNGAVVTDSEVVIAPVLVDAAGAHVARDRTTLVHITLASVAAIGDSLQVTGLGGLDLGQAHRTEDGFDVPVTVAADARRAELAVSAAGVELGRVELPLEEPGRDAPAAIADRPAWWAADLGGQIGAFLPASSGRRAPAFGSPIDPRDAVTSGPLFGPRLGIFPTPRVGLELEASIVTAGYEGKGGVASLLVTRAQVAARVFDRGSFGARVVAGAGAIATLHDFDSSHAGESGEVHYGAALTLETRQNLWLRLQGLDVITTAENGGYAHSVELQLAVVTRLGRVDRW